MDADTLTVKDLPFLRQFGNPDREVSVSTGEEGLSANTQIDADSSMEQRRNLKPNASSEKLTLLLKQNANSMQRMPLLQIVLAMMASHVVLDADLVLDENR